MPAEKGQTAILIPVPAADALVAGDDGLPAHITALYPFLPAARITDDVLTRLRGTCERLPILDVEFTRIGRFTDVVHLAPEPVEAVRRLLVDLAVEWPETPPYGGRFERVIPHLTVDLGPDEATQHLPVTARLDEACLYEFTDDRWYLRASFPFSRTPPG